jgi:PAS domain-containing protein
MQHAVVSPWMKSSVLAQTNTAALNERLALALAGSHQIAFDWHIPEDLLHFNGELEGSMKGALLDVTRVCQSRDLPALMHEDDKLQFRIHLHAALKDSANEDTYYRVEVRLRDAFRGWRWICIRGKIIERDALGRAVRMVGTFSDIDERKRHERELADREKLKSAILTAAIDCIVTVNQNGQIISFNEAAEHTFGYMEKDVLGMHLRDMLIPSHTKRSNTFETDFPLNQRIEISATSRIASGRRTCNLERTAFWTW